MKRKVKKMKKKLGMKLGLMAVLATGVLTGCGNETTGTGDNAKANVKIGVAQIVDHTSLNTIRDSFQQEMITLGNPYNLLDNQV